MTTILITGANRGLGLEFVRQYAEDGINIIAACRHPNKANKLQAMASERKNIQIETLDVGDTASINALAIKLKNTAIDILINNAGIFSGGSFLGSATETDEGQKFGTISPEAWTKVFQINVIAPVMVTQAFMSHLLQGDDKKAINITSRMGSISEMGADCIAYRSSKSALNAAMRVIMHDLKAKHIAIINMHPGWVQTDMGGKEAPLAPSTSIAGMRKVIANTTLKDTGQFLGYDGKVIPW